MRWFGFFSIEWLAATGKFCAVIGSFKRFTGNCSAFIGNTGRFTGNFQQLTGNSSPSRLAHSECASHREIISQISNPRTEAVRLHSAIR